MRSVEEQVTCSRSSVADLIGRVGGWNKIGGVCIVCVFSRLNARNYPQSLEFLCESCEMFMEELEKKKLWVKEWLNRRERYMVRLHGYLENCEVKTQLNNGHVTECTWKLRYPTWTLRTLYLKRKQLWELLCLLF